MRRYEYYSVEMVPIPSRRNPAAISHHERVRTLVFAIVADGILTADAAFKKAKGFSPAKNGILCDFEDEGP